MSIKKDRDRQAWFGLKFLSLQHAACGNKKSRSAIKCFYIVHRSDGRRSLLLAILIVTIADIVESRLYKFQKISRRAGMVRIQVLVLTARFVCEQEVTSSHTVSNHTAQIGWAQEFASNHNDFHHRGYY